MASAHPHPASSGRARPRTGAPPGDAATRARYRRILRFAARALAQSWWFDLILPTLGLGRLAARGRSARMLGIARRFHTLAVDLGGLMIKVGQFMSSRLDVLPPEITTELADLQDEVPAVPAELIRAAAEAELGMPLARAFAWFDDTPVAAASLGQVHRARLTPDLAADTGFADVVVKVQRPGIDVIVDVDLAALRRVARWMSRISAISHRADMPALVEEFARTSLEEIDYTHEARNAERFRADFAGDARVAVPEIAWERSSRRVLTLADVTAIKVTDVDALRRAGVDPVEVAAQFADVMFAQLFVHGFFHADPHPGNVFVDVRDGGAWRFVFIDFGMMGEISPAMLSGLRRTLLAAAGRDGRAMVAGMAQVGALLPTADLRELERAMSAIFARFGGMGLADILTVDPREFRDFGREFSDLMREMPFQLPENFLLVIRAASLTSGVCSSLDPDFNAWHAVEPFAARMLRAEGRGIVRDAAAQVWNFADTLAHLPRRLDDLVTHLESGELGFDSSRLEKRMSRLERLGTRAVSGIVFAGMLVGGVLLRPVDDGFGVVLMVLSVVPLGHAVLSGIFGRPSR